ncbi:17224_t:CDS:2 [Cetraspora pellucida]|uniref:17224_t:CDS:1 n=1 Tax=Cetraspora pellucida TaxID=1433469 RepID=A0A9N9I044_9GLOM|nr:17224_t:CDS:2 [Cetraspora pellucida]
MASVLEKNKVTTSEEEMIDVEPSCNGISDVGLKQKFVDRLVNKCKRKKSHLMSCLQKKTGSSNFIDESLEEKVSSFKQSLQFSGARKRFMSGCKNKDLSL